MDDSNIQKYLIFTVIIFTLSFILVYMSIIIACSIVRTESRIECQCECCKEKQDKNIKVRNETYMDIEKQQINPYIYVPTEV